jgi:hypothetical protein
LSAAYSCRKGKTKANATLVFFNNLEENIIEIQNELMWGMYKMSPYHHPKWLGYSLRSSREGNSQRCAAS